MQETNQLFTGGSALKEVQQHFNNTKAIDQTHWRIFIFCDFGPQFCLKEDTVALYQVLANMIQVCKTRTNHTIKSV